MSFNISYNIEALDSFSGVAKSVGKQMGALSKKVTDFNSKMQETGKKLTGIGKSVSLKVSAPLIAFSGFAIKSAVAFQKAMNMVGADTDSTVKQFKALKDEALKLGATTQFTATQVASAEMFLGRAGKKSADIMAMLPKVLQLASSAQMDMGDAANTVVQIMSSYHFKASQLADVNNVLVKSFTSSNVNLEMLGESFKMAGSILKVSGVDFREASAAFGVLGNSGMQATMAGTGLRRVIGTLLNPSKQLRTQMKKLNLHFVDSHNKLLPLVQIIKQLKDAGLTASGALALFGLRGGPVIENLVQNYPQLVKLNGALQHTGKIADRISKAQLKDLPGAVMKVRSAFEGLQIRLAEAVQPQLMGLFRSLTKVLTGLNTSSSGLKKWIGYTIGAGSALGPLLLGVGKFLIVSSILIDRVPFLAGATGVLGLAFRFLWKGLFGPIGLLITIGTVLVLAYKRFAIVRTVINAVGKALYLWVVKPIEVAVKAISNLITYISALDKALFKMMDKLSSLHPMLKNLGRSAIKNIVPGFDTASRAVDAIWDKIHGGAAKAQQQATAGNERMSSVNRASAGVSQHKVSSSLDVNVYDPSGIIRSLSGTSTGSMNVDLGQNMALSR